MRLGILARSIISVFILSTCLSPLSVLAASPPSQLEYAGIFIGQHVDVVKSVFGKSSGESKGNYNSKYILFKLERNADSYIAFQIMPEKPDIIFSIQLSGSGKVKMSPFLGLKLGASSKEIINKLGEPQTKRKLGKKEFWLWKDRNYTMLVGPNGRLVSIKLSGLHGFADEPDEFNGLMLLYSALSSKKTDNILRHIMPNMEIHTKRGISFPKQPLRKNVENKNSNLMKTLAYGKRSILAELDKLGTNHRAAMRISVDDGMGFVYYIKGSDYLHELVFTYFGGEWKLWKVYLK